MKRANQSISVAQVKKISQFLTGARHCNFIVIAGVLIVPSPDRIFGTRNVAGSRSEKLQKKTTRNTSSVDVQMIQTDNGLLIQ